MKAYEPSVNRVVGGARFAVQVRALQGRLGFGSGARTRDFLQQAGHDERIARINGAGRLFKHGRFCINQDFAFLVGDLGDQVRVDAVAAIGKDGISRGHLHRGDRACTQCHGQIGRVLFCLKAKVGDPFLTVGCPDGLQNTDGNHVF